MATIAAAIRFYKAKHKAITPKSVSDAVAELLALKKARGAAERHHENLKFRLKKFAEAFQCNIGDVTAADVQAWRDKLKKSNGEKLSTQSYGQGVVAVGQAHRAEAAAWPPVLFFQLADRTRAQASGQQRRKLLAPLLQALGADAQLAGNLLVRPPALQPEFHGGTLAGFIVSFVFARSGVFGVRGGVLAHTITQRLSTISRQVTLSILKRCCAITRHPLTFSKSSAAIEPSNKYSWPP